MRLPSTKKTRFPLTAVCLLLAACAPHPGAGTWRADGDNLYGITQIVVDFDGKANFSTTKPEHADLHCFWGAIEKNVAALQCTASIDPEKREDYELSVREDGIAELSHDGGVIGTFNNVGSR